MKKINFKFVILLLLVLALLVLLITRLTKSDEDDVINIGGDTIQEIEEEIVEEGLDFSSDDQQIGVVSDEEYRIVDVSETGMVGYHRIVFEVESLDDFRENIPNVSATYRGDLGAIRLVFRMISEDAGGLAYQDSINIDQGGVVRVYHNISPDETEEIYDIGVDSLKGFRLHTEERDDNRVAIFLDVEYIVEEVVYEEEEGDEVVDVEEEDIATESVEFDNEDKFLDGATSADGARVISYSYGVDGNKFKFVWTVRGSSENPTPKVQAKYNADNDIIVVFPDLESDTVANESEKVEFAGVVEGVEWNREGSQSMYKFDMREKRDFELKSLRSPNQVVLEITLY